MNQNQWLAITLAVLGVLAASTAQLTDLFGAQVTHIIISVSTLLMTLLSAILGVLTGQAGMQRSVTAAGNLVVSPKNGNAVSLAQKIGTMPEVSKVVAAPEVADAAPSEKVVSK
jgi:hypothetical protein